MNETLEKNLLDTSDVMPLLLQIRFSLIDLGWAVESGTARHLIVTENRVIEWAKKALSKEEYTVNYISNRLNELPIERQWRYLSQRLKYDALIKLNKILEEAKGKQKSERTTNTD